jgi:hypothetical protein
MNEVESTETRNENDRSWRNIVHRAAMLLGGVVLVYLAAAYSVTPLLWEAYTRRHPSFENQPTVTHTKTGIPGDPLNIGVIGSESQLKRGLLAAGWFPADPLTLRSCIDIAAATVLRRPYDQAPVSNLFLFQRKEDLAFEKPIGNDPRRRHHVRFWAVPDVDLPGQSAWIGAATLDERVGLSHTTGEITHHIGADIDAERDLLISDLRVAGYVHEAYTVPGFQKQRSGKNGGGDPWRTDGDLGVAVLQ